MKPKIILIIVFFIQFNIVAQTSFKKVLGDAQTPTIAYNFITNGSDIIISGLKKHYNINDTLSYAYLCKLSETGEVLLEKKISLQDTSIIHRDIVKGENGKFWTYAFSFKGNEPDSIYTHKILEYDYDFNLLNEFEINMPDTLYNHWWSVRFHTNLKFQNNQLILSDVITSKKVNDEGYYNSYTFYYHFNTNGDSINFNMIKNYGARFDFEIFDDETIYSTKWKSDYPNGIIINKTNISDFSIYETFNTSVINFLSEGAYLKFITDTSFVFSSIAVPEFDAYISIMDTSFNVLKSNTYGTESFQEFPARNNGLTITNDGNIYTIFSRGIATNYMLTKLDSDLNVIWERFFISGGDFLYSIKASNEGGCVILGNTYIDNKVHILLYKVDAEGNVTNIEDNKLEDVFKELSIYPNPSTTNLNIRTAVQRIGGEFKMYDISGKQIFQQKITQSITQINTANLPAGAYIYNYVHEGKVLESGKWVKE